MTVTVKPGRNFGTKNRLEALRVQLVAGEMAKQVGERIRQARLEAGLHKQRELADRMEVLAREDGTPLPTPLDNQRVSDWERGVHKPSDRYMELLARAVGRDVGWFYGRGGDTPDLSAIQGFARDDQLDGVSAEFSARVDHVEAALERIEASIEEARQEREDQAAEIRRLLGQQSELLATIREPARHGRRDYAARSSRSGGPRRVSAVVAST
jgi:transcriptional regulator with XRE-family HTH domain